MRILLFLLPLCDAFAITKRQLIIPSSSSFTRVFSSTSDNSDASDNDDFMSSLRNRITQVADRDTRLPIVVIDTMLPRQELKVEVDQNEAFQRLIQNQVANETPFFGVVGLAELSTGQTLPLQNGVRVQIVGQPHLNENGTAVRVHFKAVERFRILGELQTTSKGWTEARVQYLDSRQEEQEHEDPQSLARARHLAKGLTSPNASIGSGTGKSLIEQWIELARTKENFPGQIGQILKGLGEMPSTDEPSELAFWVGALINPLPGIRVAMEIRPLLLMARTAEERVGVAINGLQASIRHMDGTKPLF